MAAVYDIGDYRELGVTFTDVDDVATDPTSVVFTIREPDGTLTTWTYSTDAEVIRDGVGVYRVSWYCDAPGRHYWRFQSSGSLIASEASSFRVRGDYVASPPAYGAAVADFLVQAVTDLLTRQSCPEEESADDAALVAAVDAVTGLAKSYTRGRGFTDAGPVEDISAAIVTAAARLVSNPRQFTVEMDTGRGSRAYRGGFAGWSLAEQAALNRYRVRAQ